ncbi:MAG: O-acetyl-ADP-ribose deacetylase [Gammaproteobacteria bacterium]|nr:O-acetyl-ADP-ribose deacetylase [Gammaproteobacteria bacterium]
MIRVLQADITTLKVDAIVNAANESLLGGGGVDGAIHRAAGPELREYCRGLGGCPIGEARITPGFKLSAQWIIHAVGPVWRGGEYQESKLLANCYRNSFALAVENEVKTIAFPSISTGAYAYPKDQAGKIAIAIMRDYENKFSEIIACCFSAADVKLYEEMLLSSPRQRGSRI